MKNFFSIANRIGFFLVFLFIIWFFWFLIRPMHQDFQLKYLEISFFGFDGMNFKSFILGIIQSYIWGYILVILWKFSKFFSKTCPKCSK